MQSHTPGGTLMDLINENGPLGSHRAVFYASELVGPRYLGQLYAKYPIKVAAISGLHSAGVVHRDLHPKSILLDAHGHIVLANLEHAEFSSNTGILNLNQLEVDMLGYRAPELLLGWAHDSVVDCWSFGMLLYYMFFGAVNDFPLFIMKIVLISYLAPFWRTRRYRRHCSAT